MLADAVNNHTYTTDLHLRRAPEHVRFRPYDLVVARREGLERRPEYFTVSANGVVTIRRGVQAEFLPLATWVREAALFDAVSSIKFFATYTTGRAFQRWHKVRPGLCLRLAATIVLSYLYDSKQNSLVDSGDPSCQSQGVRRKNFKRVRAEVERQLFGARPTFAGTLIQVQHAVAELHDVSLAWASPAHMYMLQVRPESAVCEPAVPLWLLTDAVRWLQTCVRLPNHRHPTLQEYCELQVATREQKAKPAIEAIVDKIQKACTSPAVHLTARACM